MQFCGGDAWELRRELEVLARYEWSQLRYSVSWKGYCFVDNEDRRRWEAHSDDLELGAIVDTLEQDLRRRGVLTGSRPDPDGFARMLADTYIRFPGSGAARPLIPVPVL